MNIAFQNWIKDNEPSDNMLYKNSWVNCNIFWRDLVLPLMSEKTYFDFEETKDYYDYLDRCYEIVGIHRSKSLELPVLKIIYKGITIVFRYNFYDYEIAVMGDISFDLPSEFQSSDTESFYYQGFPQEFCLKDRYDENHNKNFMVRLFNHYEFYAFLMFLKFQIDKCR